MDPAPSTSTPRVPATPVAPNAIPGANMNDLRSLLAAAGYENAADKPTEAAQQDANHYLRLLQTRQAQRVAPRPPRRPRAADASPLGSSSSSSTWCPCSSRC